MIPADSPIYDLFFYALHGNVPGILESLDTGADVNATLSGIDMWFTFFATSKSASLEKQKEMWLAGFKKELSNSARIRTPLLLATEFDRYDAILVLLERGANPNFADEDGTTPLWAAAQRGQANIVRAFLHAGADIHAEDCEGQTPLFRAVAKGDLESVRLLLAAGADANKITSFGITPLLLAARRGQGIYIPPTELSSRRRELLSEQRDEMLADVEGQDKFDVVFQNTMPRRTLQTTPIPSVDNYPTIVAELLTHGADATFAFPSVDRSIQKTTALHEAASLGDEETVRLLFDHGANIDAEAGAGQTPLTNAVHSGNTNLIQWLLNQGAKREGADGNYFTPLMSAVLFGKNEAVHTLLENGADFTLQRTYRATVMHIAAECNNSEALQLLIAKGADTDCRNYQNQTPLMIAAKYKAVKAVQALLAGGADVHAINEAGKTAWNMGLLDSLIWWMQGGRNNKRRRGYFIYFAMALWLNGYGDNLER